MKKDKINSVLPQLLQLPQSPQPPPQKREQEVGNIKINIHKVIRAPSLYSAAVF